MEGKPINPPVQPTPSKLEAPHDNESQKRILFIGIGVLVLLALVGVTVLAIVAENRPEPENPPISVVVSNSSASPTPTPTPYVYTPSQPGIEKQEAISLFLETTVHKAEESYALSKWDQEKIRIALHGQPTSADQQCIAQIVSELNPVMESAQLEVVESTAASSFNFYILPKEQFPIVAIDAPTNEDGFIVSYSDTPNLRRATIAMNSKLPESARCWQMHSSFIRSLGLYTSTKQETPPSFISTTLPLINEYSAYDKEMVYIMYSTGLIPGLSAEEVRRRLEFEL